MTNSSQRSSARFYVRLDDAHPAMRSAVWTELELVLDRWGVCPIVAVIPANRDESICYEDPDPEFWIKVRRWQAKGWHIGLHGLTHELRAGNGGILGINAYAEFAGLSEWEQLEKLRSAASIFAAEGVSCRVFVAPAHAFDRNTLRALSTIGIDTVSDGLDVHPYIDQGLLFIPQQFWRARWMPFGTWTICLHPSLMTTKDIHALDVFLRKYASLFPHALPLKLEVGVRGQSAVVRTLMSGLFNLKKALRNVIHAATSLV